MQAMQAESSNPEGYSRLASVRAYAAAAGLISASAAFSFNFNSFLHAKEAVLCILLVLLAVMSIGKSMSAEGYMAFTPLWMFLAQSVLFRIAFFPSHVPSDSIEECVRVSLVLLFIVQTYDLLCIERFRRTILLSMRASASLVAALALAQYAGFGTAFWPVFPGYPQQLYSVFANHDLLGGLLAMTLPLTLGQEKRGRIEIAISIFEAALIAFVLLLSGCRGAWIAAAAGCIVCFPKGAAVRTWVKPVTIMVCAGVLATILAPQITVGRFMGMFSSADYGRDLRTWFFAGAWAMFLKNPLIGVGLGNYAYWSPYFQGAVLQSAGPGAYTHNAVHTLHPHNDYLEILAETGLAGAAFTGWMAFRTLRCFKRGGVGGASVAFAVFALSGYPVHSTIHLLFGLACVACLLTEHGLIAKPTPETSTPIRVRAGTFGFAAITLAAAIFYGAAVIYPSYFLRQADKAALAGTASVPLYERAAEVGWPDALMRFRFALALRSAGRHADALDQLWIAGEGLDTAEFYRAMGAVNLKIGNAVPAQESFRASLWRAPSDTESYVGLLRVVSPSDIPGVLYLAEQWLDPRGFEQVNRAAGTLIH